MYIREYSGENDQYPLGILKNIQSKKQNVSEKYEKHKP